MGQALYRKYRSKNLSEIIGQEHVTKALATALKNNHISHAYLFTGPRGIGKTSVARIIAHEINKVPYTDDSIHLDIIEIDAASNRRIDEIRDLRERVNIAPTSASYKVYIIDEVHMLTKEAFNALLKTLEEPPAHVVFILATTEAHKLPETIISRTQRFTFRPVSIDKVVAHLRYIAKMEKINISNEALNLIADHGEGSIRDSISLLDQVRNISDKITLSEVQTMLGLAPDKLIAELIDQVESRNISEIVNTLRQLREQGYEAALLAKQLGQDWRIRLMQRNTALTDTKLLNILKDLLTISASQSPFILLEIILLKAATGSGQFTNHTDLPINSNPIAPSLSPKPSPKLEPEPSHQTLKTKAVMSNPNPSTSLPGSKFDIDVWNQVLNTIKKDHNTLYGIARMAEPRFEGERLILSLQFPFHYKRLEETRNKIIILQILKDITGKPIEMVCELEIVKKPKLKPDDFIKLSEPKPVSTDNEQLNTINNIFGGGELLQSED